MVADLENMPSRHNVTQADRGERDIVEVDCLEEGHIWLVHRHQECSGEDVDDEHDNQRHGLSDFLVLVVAVSTLALPTHLALLVFWLKIPRVPEEAKVGLPNTLCTER